MICDIIIVIVLFSIVFKRVLSSSSLHTIAYDWASLT